MTNAYLVVTDLDGTLLDHDNYSYAAAEEALALLKARHIPLVLCSSKTAAEMASLHKTLALHEPFIVENGAAIYLPDVDAGEGSSEMVAFGMNRAEVLNRLAAIRNEETYSYTGFSDMHVADVMTATGLDNAAAANALQREFTEPLLWHDSDAKRERFLRKLHKAGLDAVQGGRFMHVSAGCDKGRALEWLRQWYAKKGTTPVVIALGDSENDVSMLECADLPVLVKSPVKSFPAVQHNKLYRTSATGPTGWNEALMKLLNEE